jgi:O-methyltransferase involved in polyketide biosynthesis
MTAKETPKLQGVAETLLIPLYLVARESGRPDAIIQDERAVQTIQRIDYDFPAIKLREHDAVFICMRRREFDRQVCRFLADHPEAVVVHIGCGLDSRFERLDNGQVVWYDLDFPDVINLRRQLFKNPCPRYQMLDTSVLESGWLDQIASQKPAPIIFVAEGVFVYFETEQVKRLVRTLRERFPGAELVIDAATPLMVALDNLHLAFTKMKARTHWGLKDPHELEGWARGIELLEAYYYFERPEPRLKSVAWMEHITAISKGSGIFHYRLGQS